MGDVNIRYNLDASEFADALKEIHASLAKAEQAAKAAGDSIAKSATRGESATVSLSDAEKRLAAELKAAEAALQAKAQALGLTAAQTRKLERTLEQQAKAEAKAAAAAEGKAAADAKAAAKAAAAAAENTAALAAQEAAIAELNPELVKMARARGEEIALEKAQAKALGITLTELRRMKKGLSEVEGASKSSLLSMEKFTNLLKSGLLSALAAAPVLLTGAAAGLVAFGKSAVDSALEVDNLSKRLNLTPEFLAGLELAARRAGLSLDEVADPLENLTERMVQASEGTGEASGIFKALGIDVLDTRGELRDAADVMNDLVKATGGLRSGTEKAAVAAQVFGDSGLRLLQTGILDSEEAMAAFVDAAGTFSNKASPESVASARKVQEAIGTLTTAFDSVKAAFLLAFGDSSAEGIKQFSRLFVGVMANIRSRVSDTLGAISGFSEAISLFFEGEFKQAAGVAGDALLQFNNRVANSGAASRKAVEAFDAALEGLEAVGDQGDDTSEAMAGLAKRLAEIKAREEAAAKAAADFAKRLKDLNTEAERAIESGVYLELADVQRRIRQEMERSPAAAEKLAGALTGLSAAIARTNEELEFDAMTMGVDRTATSVYRLAEAADAIAPPETLERVDQLRLLMMQMETEAAKSSESADALADSMLRVGEALEKAELAQQLQAIRTGLELGASGFGVLADAAGLSASIVAGSMGESAKAAIRLAKLTKALSLVEAIAQGALAVQKALASAPPPINFIQAGIVGAAAAVQVAAIATQKIPSYYQGTASVPAPDSTMATLHKGEAVLTRGAVDRIGPDEINRLNRREVPTMTGRNGSVAAYKHREFAPMLKDQQRVDGQYRGDTKGSASPGRRSR